MKRYEEYKESGVEWIGEVPRHWEVVPLKRAITINNGCDYKHVQVEEDGYPVIGSGGQFAWASQYMYDGEAVLLGRKGTIDKPMYYNGKFWTVDTMFYGIPKKNANCKYLYYIAKNIPFERYATATALPSMTQTDLNNNTICLPPLDEQSSIANYLDKKCSEIDKVISAQQKRIALLQELKQSVITHAVTKGLDPNVEMKDSGVEWIGITPFSWKYCRFKDFLKLRTEASESLTKIGLENIESKSGKFIETGTEFEGNGVAFSTRNIVYGKLRPYLQKVWLAEFEGNAVGDFFVFEIKKNAIPSFIKYLMLSDGFTKEADGSTVGAKMPRVSSSFILTMHYCLPSIEEQQTIVEYLTKRCASLDIALTKAQHQVELLQEYKQSLITEVVTGKRKVS